MKFAILGKEEGCTGDPARRTGNEYLFQMLATQNVEMLNNYKVKRVLSHCPHCLHTIKTEYPQFAASLPNFLLLESIQTWSGFHSQLLKKPIRWEDGYVIPSTEPGLGIELNEAVALANPYSGDRLHLEMTNHPVP